MSTNTGGPAFPCNELNGDGSLYAQFFGMSLRDHFAGLAMQAIYMRLGGGPADFDPDSMRHTASAAYAMADAMLAMKGSA